MELIRIENVQKTYKNGVVALYDFDLSIKKGEFVFVIGASGSGKSSLIKMLYREEKPDKGEIVIGGINVARLKNRKVYILRRKIGVVFQDFKLLEDRNVYENIAFAQEVIGVNSFKIKKHVIKILNLVGLRNKANKMPNELSGGEKQKVAIARAIINKPKILLADEPTGNLDEVSTNEIMNLLNTINQNGTTVVIITHDMHLVERMNKRVVRLDEGNLIYDDYGLDNQIKKYLENE